MPQKVNLIFQGGGVKGVAFVGALIALQNVRNPEIEIVSVGGVSAGAIVAALYAAGYTPDELKKELYETPLSTLVRGPLTGYLGWAPRILWSNGVHTTNRIYEWLRGLLERKQIHTFADIPVRATAEGRSCKTLKILAANVSDQCIETISDEDYSGEEVASAVAKSISIPIYFRPYIDGHRLFVDGGLLSNYPLWLFQDSPLPTVAFKLRSAPPRRVSSRSWVVDYLQGLVGTMLNAHDKARLGSPFSVVEVTIDASFVNSTDFAMEETKRDLLFANGMASVGLVNWSKLPPVRPTVFTDAYAAQVLENTASALAKLIGSTKSTANARAYDFYHQTFFVRTDGSADVEYHFQIRNCGPGPITMLQFSTAFGNTTDSSFLDLDLQVECRPEPMEAVILPIRNERIEKKFAVAFIPPIAVDDSRDVRVRFRAPTVAFHDLMEGKIDSIQVDVSNEKGIKAASVTVQFQSGQILPVSETGDKPSQKEFAPGKSGHQWRFTDITPEAWEFEATFRRV